MDGKPTDTRIPNEVFGTSSLATFFGGYCERLAKSLALIDQDAVARAVTAVEAVGERGGHIYAIGNGGSAAIADHLCCDWTKGTDTAGHKPIASHSLSSNAALYSAIANDFGFPDVFSRQLQYYGKKGDLLLAISSSGNSDNIIRALEQAKTIGITIIGLTGFSGGKLKDMADIALHVPADNYGVIEDAHQIVMHVMAQFITARRQTR
jgi:D-sedoheptulose 7-phosphate isomerase